LRILRAASRPKKRGGGRGKAIGNKAKKRKRRKQPHKRGNTGRISPAPRSASVGNPIASPGRGEPRQLKRNRRGKRDSFITIKRTNPAGHSSPEELVILEVAKKKGSQPRLLASRGKGGKGKKGLATRPLQINSLSAPGNKAPKKSPASKGRESHYYIKSKRGKRKKTPASIGSKGKG